VKWKEQQQTISLVDFETAKNRNFRLIDEQTAAARNDVRAEKLLADCFKAFSGRPEDWTVSGPCHLYRELKRAMRRRNLPKKAVL